MGTTSYNKPSNITTKVQETTLASHETTPAAEITTVNNPSTQMNQETEELTLSPETPDECKHTTNTMNPTTQPITMNPRSGTSSSSVEENGEKKTPWWPKDVPLFKQITGKQLKLLWIFSHKNSQCRLTLSVADDYASVNTL